MKILRKIWARQRLFSTIFVCFLTLLVVSFSLSTILVPHAETAEATENSWATMAEMPAPRSGLGVAVVNGRIYAIGGWGSIGDLNTNLEYDPATNTWATKKPMPTARRDFGIAVFQNKIYVIGGQVGEQDPTGVNEAYDPLTDTWETKTSMPTPRKYLSANTVNGKIYMIGGCQYVPISDNLDVNEVYDPATDSWTTKTPIPTGVEGYASAVVNNKIYILGGAVGLTLNQIYDPETDTWSFGASLPTGVDFAAAGATTGVAAPKRIYIIGGKQNLDPVNLNQIYNPETDTWNSGNSIPTPRFGLAVAVVNDVLYAIGGGLGWLKPMTAVNEQYTPSGYAAVNGPIIIRSNGRVAPGTAPIQRDGNIYTFTGNINIDSGDCGIQVDRDNIVIDGAGFTLQGTAAYISRGIDLSSRSNVTIKNMEIRNFMDGIYLVPSSNNITANTGSGIWTAGVSNNITGNHIANNNIGILFEGSHDLIYHNNFIDNTKQVEDVCWTNPWLPSSATILDDDYPSGGNYWSDYEDRYPNATELDDSGIGDTPYVIDINNQDRYPLMEPVVIPEFPDDEEPTTPTNEPFPTTLVVAAVVMVAVVGAGLLLYFVKVKKTTGEGEKIKPEGVM
jgi:parallel beta-helix repeat protein